MQRSPILAMALLAFTGFSRVPAFAAEPQRTIAFTHDLPNVPGDSLTSVIVTYPPGSGSKPHHHAASAFTFVYVLSGTVRSQVEGEPVHIYKTGQTWFEMPGAHHVVSENASTTEPASILAVFVGKTGDQLTLPDKQ